MKPRLFIGSSSETLKYAYALQRNLDAAAEVTVWTQDILRPTQHILEGLLGLLDEVDFGAFIFAGDDILVTRDTMQPTVRDNVLVEVGLFIGRLGPRATFLVAPASTKVKLPTDLLGVNMLTFEPHRRDGNIDAAMGNASEAIRRAMERPSERPFPEDLRLPILARQELLSLKQIQLLRTIEQTPQATRTALLQAHPQYSEGELHYRLEALRLLSLITASTPEAAAGEAVYSVTDAYGYARGQLLRAGVFPSA